MTISRFPLTVPSRTDLRGDCRRCVALCCTAFGFTRSADFAVDKEPGIPCSHLSPEFSCTIHDSLLGRGYRGCTVFDCFGAGQQVSEHLFPDRAAHSLPPVRRRMFAVFAAVKQLHEMLWHLGEAARRTYDPDVVERAHATAASITALTRSADEVLAADIAGLHDRVRTLLIDVSAEVRACHLAAGEPPDPALRAGADLAGRRLRGRRLCGADLRGACLIGADLRDCDLTAVDLLGADLRDSRLHGADLSAALFVTGPQLAAAHTDRRTRLPAGVTP